MSKTRLLAEDYAVESQPELQRSYVEMGARAKRTTFSPPVRPDGSPTVSQ